MRAASTGLLVAVMGNAGCILAERVPPREPEAPAKVTPKVVVTPEETARAVEQLRSDGAKLNDIGKLEAADVVLRTARDRARTLKRPRVMAEVLVELADNRRLAKNFPEARRLVAEALAVLKPGPLADDRILARLHVVLAHSFLDEKRPDSALAPLREAANLLEPHEADAQAMNLRLDALHDLAYAQQRLERHDDACATLTTALQLSERATNPDAAAVAVASKLIAAYAETKRWSDAAALAKRYQFSGRGLRPEAAEPTNLQLEQLFEPLPFTESRSASTGEPPPSQASFRVGPFPAPSDAQEKVEAMRPAFGECLYQAIQDGLAEKSSMRVRLMIDEKGRVTQAQALSLRAPVELTDCVLRRTIATTFLPPSGGGSVLVLPFTFNQ